MGTGPAFNEWTEEKGMEGLTMESLLLQLGTGADSGEVRSMREAETRGVRPDYDLLERLLMQRGDVEGAVLVADARLRAAQRG